MSEAPPFWFQKPGLAAWALSPISAVYGRITAKRMTLAPKYFSEVPVLCIGNFIAGGAGKTPTALAIAKVAKKMGLKPGFLSRGYGGSVTLATLVEPNVHNAHDVGDEPLSLAALAPTVVSVDRPAGAKLLEEQGVNIILMDDGFQNPSLNKDRSLVVIDSRRGIGNGYCMPAGPLRANMRTQLAQLSALLLIGRAEAAAPLVRQVAKMAKPIIQADIHTLTPGKFKGKRVLAFAGIADPTKFHLSLEAAGAEIVVKRSFHDHHPFSNEDCTELLSRAKAEELLLVTTQKDHHRLSRMGQLQEELLEASTPLKIELRFENPKMIEMLIREAITSVKNRKLGL